MVKIHSVEKHYLKANNINAVFGEVQVSLLVAGAVFGEVQVSLFVAGAVFGEVQVSLFVAGAVFGEVQVSLFVAGAVFAVSICQFGKCFEYKQIRQTMPKI